MSLLHDKDVVFCIKYSPALNSSYELELIDTTFNKQETKTMVVVGETLYKEQKILYSHEGS